MRKALPRPPGFWTTVRLLLENARRRANGRRRRQQELLYNRTGRSSSFSGGIGTVLTALLMTALNVCAAFLVIFTVDAGEVVEVERQGKIVVSSRFYEAADQTGHGDRRLSFPPYSREARNIVQKYGGSEVAIEKKLRDSVREHGARNLIVRDTAAPGVSAIGHAGAFPSMLGSWALMWWAVMLVFQGEGLELDLQRRRHPMWEWLFAHPVAPGAVFLAEMLSPLAANPAYWGAPLFTGILYGAVYGPPVGVLAAVIIGTPLAVATGCLGKALEIAVVLRFSPRSRGALIGIMSWIGYATMMLMFVGLFAVPKIVAAAGPFLAPLTGVPWPWLRYFLGARPDGEFSFLTGMVSCWAASAATIGTAICFSIWGAEKGLSGNFAATDKGPSRARDAGPRFGKDPLYRKEFLWFVRDRSAIVQTILIPLTVAGFQLFNLRGVLRHAQEAWNYLCGAGILFGTYFLWILGPKSLSSEGNALWIALTWPRGLENLLQAKAWLWSLISYAIVGLVLCYAVFLFPENAWQIALVGIGWAFFGRSMAEKTVTLVSIASSSGEQERIPQSRRWAAQLGMLTFAIGVLTAQWHLAVIGIVYSYITAAAMWETLRARLPYLYDPWSEKLPPPPTLMHAMVAISILVEGAAVIMGITMVFAGRDNVAVARSFSYGLCAVAVSVGMSNFLANRNVPQREIWCWRPAPGESKPWWGGSSAAVKERVSVLLLGAAAGVGLGLVAIAYMWVLRHVPLTAEMIRRSQEQMAKVPNLKIAYAVMAVGFAPFAEEYLFRGLLFRALDREWGGWRAVIGSAAFFAIYHPPLAWLPVGMVGVANAVLFKRTGHIAPAIVLHVVYNAVVLV